MNPENFLLNWKLNWIIFDSFLLNQKLNWIIFKGNSIIDWTVKLYLTRLYLSRKPPHLSWDIGNPQIEPSPVQSREWNEPLCPESPICWNIRRKSLGRSLIHRVDFQNNIALIQEEAPDDIFNHLGLFSLFLLAWDGRGGDAICYIPNHLQILFSRFT